MRHSLPVPKALHARWWGLSLALASACAAPAGPAAETPEVASGNEGEPEADDQVQGAVARASRRDEALRPSPAQLAAGIPHLRFNVELGDAPRWGPEDAPLTLVMFSDFECPYCLEAHHLVEELRRRYGDKLRFVYKAFPIDRHPMAMQAALMAHSAQAQGRFWDFHDRLYSGESLGGETLARYAAETGLSLEGLAVELEELTYAPAVLRDMRQARRLDVRSTPTFFLNGRKIKGARPLEVFEHLFEQELTLAASWRSQGVPADELYAHAIEHAYTEVVYESSRRGLNEDMVYPVPLGDAPTLGPADAPITLVAFGDFQCPFCARGEATLLRLRERFGDELRIAYRHFPLPGHSLAEPAARASWAAYQQGKFWEFHDALYERGARYERDDLDQIAVGIGLDMEAFQRDYESAAASAAVAEDYELGRALGVDGTPTYFVNGRPISGARGEMSFRLLFAEEFERAAKARASGVPTEKLYQELTGAED